MGLDNGITIKNHNKEAYDKFPAAWKLTDTKGEVYCIEPIYMRKWWGVRNEIVGYLQAKNNNPAEEYEWELSIKDIEAMRDIFYGWIDEERWGAEGDSIWSWDENIPEQLARKIAACNKLIKLKEEYPDIIIEFYDSY